MSVIRLYIDDYVYVGLNIIRCMIFIFKTDVNLQ